MRKTIALLLMIMLVLALSACGKKPNAGNLPSSDGTDQVSQPSQDEKENDTNNSEKPGSEIELPVSYKVPGKNIVIDVPNYQEIENGFTELFILHGVKYVAVTANRNSSATELGEAHEDAFSKFKENIQNSSYVNSLSVTNDSTETINGIEVYKYEGVLNCGKDTVYDAYVIGYSFIMDGVPCTVTGSVIDQSQDQTMIVEMRNTVETMIQTLRSER